MFSDGVVVNGVVDAGADDDVGAAMMSVMIPILLCVSMPEVFAIVVFDHAFVYHLIGPLGPFFNPGLRVSLLSSPFC